MILTLAFLVIGALKWAIIGVVLVGCGYAVAVSASYSCLPMVIAASSPESKHHKKLESLAVGLNMAGSGSSMIISNLTIGVIKDDRVGAINSFKGLVEEPKGCSFCMYFTRFYEVLIMT